jgi:dTDP-glucose 4,6-dehydratase
MSLRNAKVLVTGAGGFIGSHLTERLVREGARVRAFVHYRGNGSWGWLDSSPVRSELEVIAGDIADRDVVSRAVRGMEIVFHLAALIGIPYSYTAPASYLRANAEGTMNLLQASQDTGVSRVIHTSTSEVYGTARHVPITENHPLQGQSPYSASKIAADKMAEAFHLSFGTPVVTLRPFNTFGPRQSARAVIPTVISQCLSGSSIRLGSLSPTRDFNYVDNTVDAYVKAAAVPGVLGRTIHVGSGLELSVADLVKKIAAIVGVTVNVVSESDRVRPESSEVERLVADNTQARSLLGWEPAIPLDEGLRLTAQWIRDHLHEYRTSAYSI